MTTLDVLLPYYGNVALMQEAVRSVLAQTDRDWRLTVVDDGKEPGVPEWFEQLGDPRVRYFRNEQNLGVTGNYRKCLGLAEHEYLVFMGTDDVMLPNYVANVRTSIEAFPGVAMIQPGVEVIDGDGKPASSLADEAKRRLYAPRRTGRYTMGGEELAVSLLKGNWLYFPSICWRTDAVKGTGFRDNLEIIQDLALVIDLLQAGEEMAIDDVRSFQYRRHLSVSATSAFSGHRFAEAHRYFLDAADRLDAQGWHRAAKASRLHISARIHALTLVPGALRAKQWKGAKSLLKNAAAGSGRGR
ncbi:glycosyltransferase family 2 protein [Kitasatospora sp. YST-16]|uniref:glycosyltransferase family 2 protein n=1 Tax=unclassified Kitasatospora TaxID=2633591 RepID=UPI0004C39DA4|nr:MULTISPECIES: glycosyltransferase family 2 protein [unclassified Kitasatospora]WAL72265.1 glycosyltransferase family 2 protein [Kitasatospora sp. YST-16]WNW38311.1 glycosyltransferase family 2 protein [Streptomyces sp. Li-HN-5-13]